MRVPPRLEKTKRASGVTSSTFCSGRLVIAAPGCAGGGPRRRTRACAAGGVAGAVCVGTAAGAGGRTGKNFVQNTMTATHRPIARMIRFSILFLPRVPGGPRAGNRVYTTPRERLAAKKPSEGQPAAPESPVRPDRLLGVDGAGGLEPAARGEHRRDRPPVQPEQAEEDRLHEAPLRRRASVVELVADGGVIGVGGRRARDHHQIETRRELRPPTPVTVSDPALHAVAQHGAADLLADGHPEPTATGEREQEQVGADQTAARGSGSPDSPGGAARAPRAENARAAAQPPPRRPRPGYFLATETASCRRPLRRRRRITSRPERVFIRLRKPCVRLRLLRSVDMSSCSRRPPKNLWSQSRRRVRPQRSKLIAPRIRRVNAPPILRRCSGGCRARRSGSRPNLRREDLARRRARRAPTPMSWDLSAVERGEVP